MGVPISNVTRRVVYAASGTGPYAFTFEILANTDIAVYRDDTLLTLTTNYTVTINSNGTGSITLTAAPTGATQIAIVGNRTIQRTTDFVTGGDFFANTVNDEMDQQTIFAQQNAEGLQRALQAPQTDPTSINMTLPRAADRANKYLAFDANGNPEPGDTAVDVSAIAAIADEIVIVADISAAVETNAANIVAIQNASTNATNAASSAVSAASAQTAAEAARDATLAAYDNFDDRYLGAKSSDPAVDNDGNALIAGALYFNSTSQVMKLYTGSAWVAAYISGGSYVTLTGTETLTNKTIETPSITKGYTEGVYNLTGTVISPLNGSIQYKTLSANTTFTESLSSGQSVTLMIDDGTAYTVTWPTTTWKTDNGAAPTLNTTGYTVVVLWKLLSTLYGARVGNA
jgi:hypothetical protein